MVDPCARDCLPISKPTTQLHMLLQEYLPANSSFRETSRLTSACCNQVVRSLCCTSNLSKILHTTKGLIPELGLLETESWSETIMMVQTGYQLLSWKFLVQLLIWWKLHDHGQKWKRHADQIKDWLLPAPRVAQETENSNSEVDSDNFETASEVSGPEPDPSTEDTADSSSPGAEPDTESPVEETNPPEAEHSSTIPCHYPIRARQPPNRYYPAGFGTNRVMII